MIPILQKWAKKKQKKKSAWERTRARSRSNHNNMYLSSAFSPFFLFPRLAICMFRPVNGDFSIGGRGGGGLPGCNRIGTISKLLYLYGAMRGHNCKITGICSERKFLTAMTWNVEEHDGIYFGDLHTDWKRRLSACMYHRKRLADLLVKNKENTGSFFSLFHISKGLDRTKPTAPVKLSLCSPPVVRDCFWFYCWAFQVHTNRI